MPSVWVNIGDRLEEVGRVVIDLFQWEHPPHLRNELLSVTVFKPINCLIIHIVSLIVTHMNLTALYRGKMIFTFRAMVVHGKTGIRSHVFWSHVENYIHYKMLNYHRAAIFYLLFIIIIYFIYYLFILFWMFWIAGSFMNEYSVFHLRRKQWSVKRLTEVWQTFQEFTRADFESDWACHTESD